MLADGLVSGVAPTWTSLITALSTLFIAAGGFITAIAVLLPALRNMKAQLTHVAKQVDGNVTSEIRGQLHATERELDAVKMTLSSVLNSGISQSSELSITRATEKVTIAERRVADLRVRIAEREAQEEVDSA